MERKVRGIPMTLGWGLDEQNNLGRGGIIFKINGRGSASEGRNQRGRKGGKWGVEESSFRGGWLSEEKLIRKERRHPFHNQGKGLLKNTP